VFAFAGAAAGGGGEEAGTAGTPSAFDTGALRLYKLIGYTDINQ
jgi:hypothetical protein